jgi:hypothetical protein
VAVGAGSNASGTVNAMHASYPSDRFSRCRSMPNGFFKGKTSRIFFLK